MVTHGGVCLLNRGVPEGTGRRSGREGCDRRWIGLGEARSLVGVNLEEGQVWSIKFLAPLAGCLRLEVGMGYNSRLLIQPSLNLVGRRYQRGQGPEGLYYGHPRCQCQAL